VWWGSDYVDKLGMECPSASAALMHVACWGS